MINILISFVCGFAFIFGTIFGMGVWVFFSFGLIDLLRVEHAAHFERVEDRLAKQVDALQAIQVTLETNGIMHLTQDNTVGMGDTCTKERRGL